MATPPALISRTGNKVPPEMSSNLVLVNNTQNSQRVMMTPAGPVGRGQQGSVKQGKKTQKSAGRKKGKKLDTYCQICSRDFPSNLAYDNHMNTHTGARPYKCNMCPAAFNSNHERVRHIRYKHTFEKPLKCKHCQFATCEGEKLTIHMRTHTNERPFKCKECDKGFGSHNSLARHKIVHTKEKPFICIKCFRRYGQSNALKQHLITTHKVEQCNIKLVKPLTLADVSPNMETFLRQNDLLRPDNSFSMCLKHYQVLSKGWEPTFQKNQDVGPFQDRAMAEVVVYDSPEKSDSVVARTQSGGPRHVTLEVRQGGDSSLNLTVQQPTAAGVVSKTGDRTGSGRSQDLCIPLTGHMPTAMQRLKELKRGLYGMAPHVILVHPDGSVEDVTTTYKECLPC